MSSAKKKTKELSPREMRLELAKSLEDKEKELTEDEVRKEFKDYFVKLKRKIGLESSLEQIIWLHLKASGFDKKEKFDEGVRHFGYDI